jgi:hypothetical protein
MSSISSSSGSVWGSLGAADWRHAPVQAPQGTPSGPLEAHGGLGAGWFGLGAAGDAASLTSEVGPAARSLSVQQHATRVLAALCG